jgi:hypothetical protein
MIRWLPLLLFLSVLPFALAAESAPPYTLWDGHERLQQ